MENDLFILETEIKKRLIEEWEYPEELIHTKSSTKDVETADIIVLRDNNIQRFKENTYIVVEIKKEYSKKGISQLKNFMDVYGAEYGIFYNGKDIIFLRKLNDSFQEIIRIPKYGEKLINLEKQVRKDQLKPVFDFKARLDEIYRYIYANEGFLKEKLSNELIKLILMKIVDEKSQGWNAQFWISEKEYERLIEKKESKLFVNRIQKLWNETKSSYPDIFPRETEITFQPRTIAEIVRRLQEISFTNTKDIKNAIFETLIRDKTIRRKGELFTPPSIIELAIMTLNPSYQDYVIDPTCGSGKFLIEAIKHIKSEDNLDNSKSSNYSDHIIGIDFNPELVKLAKLNMILFGTDHPHIFNGDSLFSLEKLVKSVENRELLQNDMFPLSFDLVFSNPPNVIHRTSSRELEKFDLACKWEFNTQDNEWIKSENLLNRQRVDILFIERCWQLLKPNGRMGIILPDDILINSSLGYVRQWIMNNTKILASISLPIDTFQPETNMKCSLLLLQKINNHELFKLNESGYSIFMAQIDKIGHDRRGNAIYQRDDNGKILKDVEGNSIIDSDIPEIITQFNEFKKKNSLDF